MVRHEGRAETATASRQVFQEVDDDRDDEQARQQPFRRYWLDGAEVTDEILASAASTVIDEAGNRMHTMKAVLVHAFGGR